MNNNRISGKVMCVIPESNDLLEILTKVSFLNLSDNKKNLLVLATQYKARRTLTVEERKNTVLECLYSISKIGNIFSSGYNFSGRLEEKKREICELSNEEVKELAKELIVDIENGNINIW